MRFHQQSVKLADRSRSEIVIAVLSSNRHQADIRVAFNGSSGTNKTDAIPTGLRTDPLFIVNCATVKDRWQQQWGRQQQQLVLAMKP